MSADSLILLNGLLRTKFWGGFLRLRFAMAGLRGTSGSSFFFSDVSTAPQGEARHRVGREGCCRSMQKGKSRSASDAYLVGPGSFPQTYQQNCENRMGAVLGILSSSTPSRSVAVAFPATTSAGRSITRRIWSEHDSR